MGTIYTIEGNTSGGSTLVANGGCVAKKSYVTSYPRIAKVYRLSYKKGERDKVLKVASKYIGYCEKKSNSNLNSMKGNAGYNNYTRFARDYKAHTGINVQGQAWCDVFVDEVLIEALGEKRAKELLGGFSAYTPDSSSRLARTNAKVISPSEAKYGDIIFFKNSERICHTGYIATGYGEKKKASSTEYTQKQFIKDVCSILKVSSAKKAFAKTITISKNSNHTNALVLPIQKYLKALGYYKGVCDKNFGSQTESAVKLYQERKVGYNAKSCDGVISAKNKTWKKLLNL